MLLTQAIGFECRWMTHDKFEFGAYNHGALELANINSNALMNGWMLNQAVNQGRHRQNIRLELEAEAE